jgi:hypothetical protein
MKNTTQEGMGDCANCPNGKGLPNATGRRGFLNYLLGTSFGATLIAILYPIARFVTPPEVIEAMQSSLRRFRVSFTGHCRSTVAGDSASFSTACRHGDYFGNDVGTHCR